MLLAAVLATVMAAGALRMQQQQFISHGKQCPSTASSVKSPIGIVVPSADHGWTAALSSYLQKKVKELGLAEGKGYMRL